MTPVRQRMIEDMRLRGFSARTQESCVSAVRHLATDFQVSPDRLTEEDLWQWTAGLINGDCFGTVETRRQLAESAWGTGVFQSAGRQSSGADS